MYTQSLQSTFIAMSYDKGMAIITNTNRYIMGHFANGLFGVLLGMMIFNHKTAQVTFISIVCFCIVWRIYLMYPFRQCLRIFRALFAIPKTFVPHPYMISKEYLDYKCYFIKCKNKL